MNGSSHAFIRRGSGFCRAQPKAKRGSHHPRVLQQHAGGSPKPEIAEIALQSALRVLELLCAWEEQRTTTAISPRRAQLQWLFCLKAIPQLHRSRSLAPLVFRGGMLDSWFWGELSLCLVPAPLGERGQPGTGRGLGGARTPGLNCTFLLHPSDNRNSWFSVQWLASMVIPSPSGLLVPRGCTGDGDVPVGRS